MHHHSRIGGQHGCTKTLEELQSYGFWT